MKHKVFNVTRDLVYIKIQRLNVLIGYQNVHKVVTPEYHK